MRILTISNCPLVETQGSGYVILNFCRGLRNRGHHVDVFGPESFEPFQFLRSKGRIYRQTIGMVLLAFRQLMKERYDVIEYYGAESWLSILILRAIPKRKFLLVTHSNGLETHCYERLLKYLGTTTLDGSSPKWYQVDQSPVNKLAFTKSDGLITVGIDDRNFAVKNAYQDDAHIIAIENYLLES